MCLLLTLLAVPVFYSLFDDAKELTLFKRIGGGMEKIKDALIRLFRTKYNGHDEGDAEIHSDMAEDSPGK